MALLMFREEVSSAPPAWTDWGSPRKNNLERTYAGSQDLSLCHVGIVPFSLSPAWTY